MALGGEREREQRRGEGAASEGEEPGKQEVAGAASAPTMHLFVLLAEEEEDGAAPLGWAATMLGQVGCR